MDQWTDEVESIESIAVDINQKIYQRNQCQKNSLSYSRADVQVTNLIKSFNSKVDKLQELLIRTSSTSRLTRAEVDRRQRIIDQLRSKATKMDIAAKDNLAPSRSALLGSNSNQVYNSTASGSSSLMGWNELDDSFVSRGLSSQQITSRQVQLIREQDSGLETLDDIIKRQKYMAAEMGTEINLQNEIIDDVADVMDQTNDRLIRNTRNIKKVDRKSNTCGYWIVIILLFIAIVTIAFV